MTSSFSQPEVRDGASQDCTVHESAGAVLHARAPDAGGAVSTVTAVKRSPLGRRVEVIAHWSSFYGRIGRVVEERERGPMVVLDGEAHLVPMAFGRREVASLEDEPHVTAGE